MAPKSKREDTGELMVSIEQYTKTRDSVIVALSNLQGGLTHVQNGLNDLLRAYMQHTASILAGEDGDLDKLQIPSTIAATASAAMEAATSAANGVTQVINTATPATTVATDGKGKKRKREKKEKDPNAPKKPLTAAFLYHQHARPVVRADLESTLGPGQTIEKNAVQLEVNKRWNELPEEEKEQWKASYRNSMEEYKVELAEYLANGGAKAAADLHEDEEASDEAEIEVDVNALDSDASSEDEDEAPPVTKAPSPPAKTPRKRQKTGQTPAVNGTSLHVPIAPASSGATPVPLPTSRTATQVPPPTSITVAETPAKKDKKKKAPQPIAPAPAVASSHDEPSPEESGAAKKKSKSSRSTRNAEAEGDKENAAAAAAAAAASSAAGGNKKEKRDRSKRKSEAAS